MTKRHDLVIRGGTVADGAGGGLYDADIAIDAGRITQIGTVSGGGAEEIDARGMLVTPGFIDLHTHLDGHVTWEQHLQPATGHGVTTALTGNCGVGFAPCRPQDHDNLIHMMETVEDIPFADLSKGIPWGWESFPQYLDVLAARRYNMDIATLVPHSTLRAYVMGERALGERASAADLAEMKSLMHAAIEAGAFGFGSSTLRDQRTSDGRPIPSLSANEDEFTALALGMKEAGHGVIQIAVEFNQFPLACDELEMFARVGKASGLAVMFSLKQTNIFTEGWRDLLRISDRANSEGVAMHPQVLGRPTGAIFGLRTGINTFSRCPSYAQLAGLSMEEKLAALKQPEIRQRLIAEAQAAQMTMPERLRGYHLLFPLGDPPVYEPLPEQSIHALALARGVAPEELAYELLLENDGNNLFMLAGGNFAQFSLDPSLEMLKNPYSVPGLGDAGAHASIICDASISTYMLSYWTRDRQRGAKLSVPEVVKKLTADSARVIGLHDRGLIKAGYKADLNVIDYDRLTLRAPKIVYDLPAGSPRLIQPAQGYVATVVSGEIVHRNDQMTERLSGRLVRGGQSAPH